MKGPVNTLIPQLSVAGFVFAQSRGFAFRPAGPSVRSVARIRFAFLTEIAKEAAYDGYFLGALTGCRSASRVHRSAYSICEWTLTSVLMLAEIAARPDSSCRRQSSFNLIERSRVGSHLDAATRLLGHACTDEGSFRGSGTEVVRDHRVQTLPGSR